MTVGDSKGACKQSVAPQSGKPPGKHSPTIKTFTRLSITLIDSTFLGYALGHTRNLEEWGMQWESDKYTVGIREKLIEYSKCAFIFISFFGSLSLGAFLLDESTRYVRDFIHYKIGFDRGSLASEMVLICLALSACFVFLIIYLHIKPLINSAKYFFYSKEKKAVIKCIIIIEENIKKECSGVSKETLLQITNESIAIIKQSKQLKQSVQSGKLPLYLALKVIEYVLYTKITSGQGYVYRGVMGVEAHENKSAWSYVLNEMCDLGYVSQEEAQDMRRNLDHEIRQVG